MNSKELNKAILFVANYKSGSGGISTQVDILSDLLRKEGYSIGICSLKGTVLTRIKALTRICKVAKNYDVIHIHACSRWGFVPAVIGIKVGKKLGKKIVLTYHGGGAKSFFGKHTRLVKKYLGQTDTNIVLSGFLCEVFCQYDIPCVIVPNIIELREGVYRDRASILPNFISIRSFTPTYNMLCTLKAFQTVKQKFPQATLTLLGGGPLRSELEAFVCEQKIDDVNFVGVVPNEVVYDYLDKADVMLSSPLTDNMPVSLLEGFNAGLLVISSRVGGVPYMIQDGVNGLLFSSENAKEMADKMIQAIENQEKTKEMIRNAHEDLRSYSWENNREKYFSIYQ